jgi:IS30 family transposase
MQRQRRKLTVEDRVAIELRRKDGVRAIARELGRSPSVISAELGREPDGNYAAGPAQAAAAVRWGTSGKAGSPLFAEVAAAAAGADRGAAPGGGNGSVVRTTSEAIYQAIYAVPRGELRRELLACQGKPHRGPRTANGGAGSATSSASGRRRWRVPGHWEGDLIKGNRSSVGTLVQPQAGQAGRRQSRDGTRWFRLLAVPAPLRLTLTYDQGKEMARHKELAALTGLRVYFAHAPWQRGSNENTNGLLRQYLAQGHRPVGVLAARRDRRPAQQAQDARLRDTRRGVRRAGGQGRQRRHGTKCGGCSLRNLNPPRDFSPTLPV